MKTVLDLPATMKTDAGKYFMGHFCHAMAWVYKYSVAVDARGELVNRRLNDVFWRSVELQVTFTACCLHLRIYYQQLVRGEHQEVPRLHSEIQQRRESARPRGLHHKAGGSPGPVPRQYSEEAAQSST